MSRPALRPGILPVLFFSAVGFLTMGYHPGAEDDAVYLAAIKSHLNPALFPHDSAFFKLQMQASLFDNFMAAFVRVTHIPLGWSEILWQCIAIALTLWASWRLLCHLFDDAFAQWGGLAALSAMLTLPVAGSALYIADQYLHPRNLATAFILLAAVAIPHRRWIRASILLALASLLHPMMAAFGISFCLCFALCQTRSLIHRLQSLVRVHAWSRATQPAIVALPVSWLLQAPAPGWIDAMTPRHSFWLYQWTWYEWLGAIAPLLIFFLLTRWAHQHQHRNLARFSLAVLVYGTLHQAIAMILCGPRSLVVLATLEPMRYLQLVYVFMVLLTGAFLAQIVLRSSPARWAAFLLLFNIPMFLVQRSLFPATPHIELPGRDPANPWLDAFAWIRSNTPADAYFALGPRYFEAPGEDTHSFRALAERSVLADDMKDRSVLSKAPQLVPDWQRQVTAQQGWDRFQLSDFEQLKSRFGVDWLILDHEPSPGLPCPWHDHGIFVCRVP